MCFGASWYGDRTHSQYNNSRATQSTWVSEWWFLRSRNVFISKFVALDLWSNHTSPWTDSCWVGFIVAHWITTAAGCLAAKIRWVRPGAGEFVLRQPTLWECLSTQAWEQQCVWTARRLCQSISCISDSLYASRLLSMNAIFSSFLKCNKYSLCC